MGVRVVGDFQKLNAKVKRMTELQLGRVTRQVGEALVSSTIQRFDDQRAPDGTPWQPLAAATVAPSRKDYHKDGRLRKGAEKRLQNRKILIQTARLRNSISYKADGTKVAVGTNVRYGRIHQLGGNAGRGKGVYIPARPYLGISPADQAEIERVVKQELAR